MEIGEPRPGVSAMSVYVPPLRVDLEHWCEWTGNSWDKISAVVGRSFRVPGRHENVYTMAANAVLRLIRKNDIDPRRIGFLGLGTESSTDNAAGAVIVRGMVDHALEQLGMPRLVAPARGARVQARLPRRRCTRSRARSATWRSTARERQAIVVSADVAEYERGTHAASRRRARARWRCWSSARRSCSRSICRTPAAPRTTAGPISASRSRATSPRATRRTPSASATSRCSAASTRPTRTSTRPCTRSRTCSSGSDVSAGSYYESVRALFFHRPYHLMPVQAMAFLYVRGLARGDHHQDELRGAVRRGRRQRSRTCSRETASTPDLYADVLEGRRTTATRTPPPAPSRACCASGRRSASCCAQKMSLGAERREAISATSTAPRCPRGSRRASRRRAPSRSCRWRARRWSPSVTAAATRPRRFRCRPVQGWEAAAPQIGFGRGAREGASTSTRDQYEALHDGRESPGTHVRPERRVRHRPRRRRATRASFQDLGVEYYEYAV